MTGRLRVAKAQVCNLVNLSIAHRHTREGDQGAEADQFQRGGTVASSLMIMMSPRVGREHLLQGVQGMLIKVEAGNRAPGTPTGGMRMRIQHQAMRKAT
jgi:hypothetical protein